MNELSFYEDNTVDFGTVSICECDRDCHTESDHDCYDD